MGLCTNALPEAMALGLVLELFWIDGLRLGTIVPPSATLSFLLLFPLCFIFDWFSPSELPLPLLVCIVFAHVSAWLERWHRARNALHDAQLEHWVEAPTQEPYAALSPEHIILRSHWRVLWSSALVYMFCFALVYVFFKYLVQEQLFPVFYGMSWSQLYGVGLLGAILALRTRRVYVVLSLALVGVVFWQALGGK